MIQVHNLKKKFDDFQALNGVEMHVGKGDIYGLVGPNGAGKSTLIRHLTGVYKADEGEILIDGEPVFENRNIKQRMAYIPDELFYFMQADTMEMKRFYEGIYPQFDSKLFYKMQEFFPEQLKHVTAEQMYRAVNKVQPSLIRTEADELTYSLHVMVRYEIEKQLIDGSLEVKDIPEVWNRLYKEYLGVDVSDDRRGCLQDSHWSGGSFGYFPSYALGSAYGAQMLCNMEKDFPVWEEVRAGKLTGVSAWLKEKVHQYGSLLTPGEIVKNACGDFDPTVYTDYLTEKYTKLYDL